jgi:hypothetical protein
MPADTITLTLEGDVRLSDYAAAVGGLQQLVTAMGTEIAHQSRIEWTIEALDRSSTITTVRGTAAEPEVIDRITTACLIAGRHEAEGRPIPYGRPVIVALETITGILNGHVQVARLETAEGDVALHSATSSKPPTPIQAYGAITGRIQALTNRNGLRFTLYDLLHDKAVGCYLTPGNEETMRGMWGRLAIVEGWVTRDRTTGRPLSIRRISQIVPKIEVEPGSYRHALGAVSWPEEAKSPEIIRRMRDAR